MHLAPACTFWLALGMFAVEWPSMQANDALLLMARRPFLYLTGKLPVTDPLLAPRSKLAVCCCACELLHGCGSYQLHLEDLKPLCLSLSCTHLDFAAVRDAITKDASVLCSCGNGFRGEHAGVLRDPAGVQPDAEGAGDREECGCRVDRHPLLARDRDASAGASLGCAVQVAADVLISCVKSHVRTPLQHAHVCAGLWVRSELGWICMVQPDQAATQAFRIPELAVTRVGQSKFMRLM